MTGVSCSSLWVARGPGPESACNRAPRAGERTSEHGNCIGPDSVRVRGWGWGALRRTTAATAWGGRRGPGGVRARPRRTGHGRPDSQGSARRRQTRRFTADTWVAPRRQRANRGRLWRGPRRPWCRRGGVNVRGRRPPGIAGANSPVATILWLPRRPAGERNLGSSLPQRQSPPRSGPLRPSEASEAQSGRGKGRRAGPTPEPDRLGPRDSQDRRKRNTGRCVGPGVENWT